MLEKELALELDGEPVEWAEYAIKTWKKQGSLVRNRGKVLRHSFVALSSDIVKRQRAKAKKGREGKIGG